MTVTSVLSVLSRGTLGLLTFPALLREGKRTWTRYVATPPPQELQP